MRQQRRTVYRTGSRKLPNCLDEAILQEVAAGIAPPEVMEKHGEHVAKCDRCAPLLKRYLFEFSDELTAEEEVILSQLETSTPEGQKKLVDKILRHINQHHGGQTES